MRPEEQKKKTEQCWRDLKQRKAVISRKGERDHVWGKAHLYSNRCKEASPYDNLGSENETH
jgi:hypothetical protein